VKCNTRLLSAGVARRGGFTVQLLGCKRMCSVVLAVVALGRGSPYRRPMTIFGNTNPQHGGPSGSVNRVGRLVGRLLLWGCVLLLLIRGIASYLASNPNVVTTTRGTGTTVTQPAPSGEGR
jgi:hypothetical protein